MTVAEFVADFVNLVGLIAWPVMTGLVILAFRDKLESLIDRLKRIKGGGMDAEFERTRDATVAAVSSLPPEAKEPQAIIQDAWVHVELALDLVASRREALNFDNGMSAGKKIEVLFNQGIISNKERNALNGLLTFRNLATHSPSVEVTLEKAKEFSVLATANNFILSTKSTAK